jgi:uroporphyrinogen-III synthase
LTRIFVLRPEPGASATLARAVAMGLTATALPLFEIEPVPWQAPDPQAFDVLLLTSANAVRQAGPQLAQVRALPVYAVGKATAAAARAAGLEVVLCGDGGVRELLSDVPGTTRLLHLCGDDRTAAPGKAAISAVPVYRSVAIPCPVGLERLPGSVALVHSPRAGLRLGELVADRREIGIAAISIAAADACGSGWAVVEAASQPNDAALLSLAARLCQQLDPK